MKKTFISVFYDGYGILYVLTVFEKQQKKFKKTS